MFVTLYVVATCFLLLVALTVFLVNRNYFSFNWWSGLVFFLLVYAFVFQLGAWPYFGYYVRYFWIFACALLTWMTYFRRGKQPRRKNRIFPAVLLTLFNLLFLAANIETIRGNYARGDETIDLEFPFRNGNYVIQQGGHSELNNLSHRSRIHASEALDIFKINSDGKRASKLISQDVNDYAIYGDTVYSPCDCVVQTAFNGIDDNVPPVMNTIDRGGNYIVLRQDDVNIILCHLLKNSLLVKKGQIVKKGQPLGTIGNSGFSIEPHLHLQAYRGGIRGNDQLVITFNGKVATMNDLFRQK